MIGFIIYMAVVVACVWPFHIALLRFLDIGYVERDDVIISYVFGALAALLWPVILAIASLCFASRWVWTRFGDLDQFGSVDQKEHHR